MRAEQLLDAFNQVDPEYVEEAEHEFHKKRRSVTIKRWGAIAACLCIFATGMSLIQNQKSGSVDKASKGESRAEDGSKTETDSIKSETSAEIPQEVFVGNDCYKLVESTKGTKSNKQARTYIGALGKENDYIHSNTGIAGGKVYKVDDSNIIVKIGNRDYQYKKMK